jgi:LmbE family N-acetylglucosaminyl deacetylase
MRKLVSQSNDILGKRMLVITAHPDDECYMAGGLMYENYRHGGITFLVCATLGERGQSHLKTRVSLAQMKRVRRRELLAAARALHIAKVHTFGLPDGRVAGHAAALYRRIMTTARRVKPEIIVSFGPDGISGHRDHVAAGLAARRAARTLHLPLAAATLPPAVRRAAFSYLMTRRAHGHYKRSVTFQRPTMTIRINGRMKRRALSRHRSQMDGPDAFTGFPPFAVRALLKAEHFRVSNFRSP